jgi:LEA14-like dessication related protein
MFLSARRIILIITIAVIVMVIVLYPYILKILAGKEITNLSISLKNITLVTTNITSSSVPLMVHFSIFNPTDKALTTSRIEYALYANGVNLGNNTLSYEDIPLNGRPQFYSGKNADLQSYFKINNLTESAKLFKEIINNANDTNRIKWEVRGEALIDSAFTSEPKSFTTTLN